MASTYPEIKRYRQQERRRKVINKIGRLALAIYELDAAAGRPLNLATGAAVSEAYNILRRMK